MNTDFFRSIRSTRFWIVTACLAAVLLSGCAKTPLTPEEQVKTFYKSADWVATVDLSTKLLRESPKDTKTLYYRAQSYVALKMYDEAIADYTAIIKLKPEDPEGYYGRELAYRRLAKTTQTDGSVDTVQIERANADGARGRELDVQYKTAYAFDHSNFTRPSGIDAGALSGNADQNGENGEAGSNTGNPRRDDLASDDSRDADNNGTPDSRELANELEGLETGLDGIGNSGDSEWGLETEADLQKEGLANSSGFGGGSYDPLGGTSAKVPNDLSTTVANSTKNQDAAKAAEELEKTIEAARLAAEAAAANPPASAAENIADNGAVNLADNKADNTLADIDSKVNEIAEMFDKKMMNKSRAAEVGDNLIGGDDPAPANPINRFVPGEPQQLPESFVAPQRPSVSTAMPLTPAAGINPGSVQPLGMPSAPGIAAPRATGISSNTLNAGSTPLPQSTVGSGNNGIAGTPPNTGFQPGKFQGNTIYSAGTQSPTISTALPGTGPAVAAPAPGFAPRTMGAPGIGGFRRPSGPILSTQLPANRMVAPGTTARPTGITSGGSPGTIGGRATFGGATIGSGVGNGGFIGSGIGPTTSITPPLGGTYGGGSSTVPSAVGGFIPTGQPGSVPNVLIP